jgi:hypothetical protein
MPSEMVEGVDCKNGHFNDLDARYCAVCGVGMGQLTKVRQRGKRPPLGVLILSDGSVCQLDADYVIGREPTLDSAVAEGRARPLRLIGASGAVSRIHARVELDGWQVFISDLNSANGTQIIPPGHRNAVTLKPGARGLLVAGAQIRLGGEYVLRYDSHRHRVIDDDVRFTVYRPQALSPGVWASLLVFAHKTELVVQPGRAPLDPAKQVEDIARVHFGDMPVRPASEDARGAVFRGTRLRIAPDLPGLACNPDEAEFDWWEPVHQVEFRLLAGPGLVGSVVRGAVRIWCGPLLLGEVSLAITITASKSGTESPVVLESALRYRKIFPSYSHDDREIVDAFAEAARALGDQYLQDVLALRSGERWRDRLPELIEEADIFQLFWSSNSMRSRYCREEWEHALALRRPFFVRPLYWEDPLPQDQALGLPPGALRELEFVRVRSYPTREGTPASSGELPDAGVGLGAPAGASSAYAPPPPAPGQLDAYLEAHEALNSVVANYGPRILSDPRMLGNVVADLLPDLPRERSLLVTAAESDVAGDLTRHVEEHHLDPDTAVQLVARSLTDRRALDPAASTWVTTEYVQALGYNVSSGTQRMPQPPGQDTLSSCGQDASPQQAAPPENSAPPYGVGYFQPSGYPLPQGPPLAGRRTVGPQQGRPPWASAPARKRRNLAPVVALGGAALIIVLYLIIAAIAHIAPFGP